MPKSVSHVAKTRTRLDPSWLLLGGFGPLRERLSNFISSFGPMSKTGGKRKLLASNNALHAHRIASSTTISISQDDRRLKVKTSTFGESSQVAEGAQHPQDLATLEALGNLDSFSYLLGQELPIGPEDNALGFDDSDAIQVTMKAKRNEKSVSPKGYDICHPLTLRLLLQDFPLSAWIPFRDEYLDEMLRLEGRGGSQRSAMCFLCRTEANPEFRCAEGCCGGGMTCRECTLSSHKRLPLHWIEVRHFALHLNVC